MFRVICFELSPSGCYAGTTRTRIYACIDFVGHKATAICIVTQLLIERVVFNAARGT